MSEVKVNKISPRTNCGTVQLGDSGDTITIPAGATITNNGTASGFGSTGEVSWNTTKITADPGPAVSGVGYFADTSSAAFTITLPASPSAGNVVAISDYSGNFATNAITVGRNSSNINGSASDFFLNKDNVTAQFIYVDATQGWRVVFTGDQSGSGLSEPFITATGGTILECGDYKIHVFTSPGTFCVSSIGSNAPQGGPSNADYLVVAGGGGSNYGGGGAGGFRQSVTCAGTIPLSISGFPITVGGGGAATASGCASRGSNSIFSSITSAGGGASGGATPYCTSSANAPGGSGAGAPGFDFPAPGPGTPPGTTHQIGGAGNTPPVSPPQGNAGGRGHGTYGIADNGSGGGGGAGSSAADTVIGTPGGTPGAAGAPTLILGSTPTAPSYGESGPSPGRYFAGGGGGSQQNPGTKPGGVGGGGDGQPGPSGSGCNGATNMGGGAGGRSSAGGSGIVIIRYKFQ